MEKRTMTADGDRFVRKNSGTGHSYKVGDRKVPGVTSILSAGVPKPGLINWASSSVAEYVVDRLQLVKGHVLADDLVRDVRNTAKYPVPEGLPRVKLANELSYAPSRERDAGGLKGQQVHDIAQKLAETGEWTPGDDEEHLEGYADALVDWWHRWDPTGLVLVERSVLNRTTFYAGTFDLYAEHAGGYDNVLLDYKAGRSGIFGETALQVAAYAHAEVYADGNDELPMPPVDHCLAVWLRPDGTHETYELDAGPAAFRLFQYVYQVAVWQAGPDLFGTDGQPAVRGAVGEPIFPRTTEEAAS
jgi:hypothetical protein